MTPFNSRKRHILPVFAGRFWVALAGTLAWCIWNESFALDTLVLGGVLSVVSLGITNRYLLKTSYHKVFTLHPLTLLRYILVLGVAIFRSGLHAIAITLTGRITLGVVDITTRVENPFHRVLIASAITMTPGTVTLDHEGNRFKVIWIECTTTDPEAAGERIKGGFERVFLPDPKRKDRR